MSRFYYFTILLIFSVLSTASFTQEVDKTGGWTRLASLGTNPYVTDPFVMTINPAWGGAYDNFLFGDIGFSTGTAFSAGGSPQFIAASFNLGNGWTVGGLLARNDFTSVSIALLDPGDNFPIGLPNAPFGVVSAVNNIVGAGLVTPLDNNMQLMGTYRSGKHIFGLAVAYASTTSEFTPDGGSTATGSASQLGINAGILSELSNDFLLDAGFSLILPGASYEPGGGSKTEASQTIIIANARAFWEMTSKVSLVPVFVLFSGSGTLDNGVNSTSSDMTSMTTIGAGLGVNYSVGDFLLAGGPSFAVINSTIPAVSGVSPELNSSAFIFPIWNLGIEWSMLDWLTARLGYIAETGKATVETTSTATTVNETVFTFFLPPNRGITMGLGFRLGDFSLDAYVYEDVLRQGLNNIGGGGPTFASISAGYAIP
ncbi:MAG: hypothetical protein Kow0098_10510 [Ignavibacteriaceae bacterium]